MCIKRLYGKVLIDRDMSFSFSSTGSEQYQYCESDAKPVIMNSSQTPKTSHNQEFSFLALRGSCLICSWNQHIKCPCLAGHYCHRVVAFWLFNQLKIETLTAATWSCRRRAGSTECFPSGPGPSRRSCRRCVRSWRSRSWWRPCLGSAARWGRTRTTAPDAPPPWGWGRGCWLDRETLQSNKINATLTQQTTLASVAARPIPPLQITECRL